MNFDHALADLVPLLLKIPETIELLVFGSVMTATAIGLRGFFGRRDAAKKKLEMSGDDASEK